jgi:hypothetical protein
MRSKGKTAGLDLISIKLEHEEDRLCKLNVLEPHQKFSERCDKIRNAILNPYPLSIFLAKDVFICVSTDPSSGLKLFKWEPIVLLGGIFSLTLSRSTR